MGGSTTRKKAVESGTGSKDNDGRGFEETAFVRAENTGTGSTDAIFSYSAVPASDDTKCCCCRSVVGNMVSVDRSGSAGGASVSVDCALFGSNAGATKSCRRKKIKSELPEFCWYKQTHVKKKRTHNLVADSTQQRRLVGHFFDGRRTQRKLWLCRCQRAFFGAVIQYGCRCCPTITLSLAPLFIQQHNYIFATTWLHRLHNSGCTAVWGR